MANLYNQLRNWSTKCTMTFLLHVPRATAIPRERPLGVWSPAAPPGRLRERGMCGLRETSPSPSTTLRAGRPSPQVVGPRDETDDETRVAAVLVGPASQCPAAADAAVRRDTHGCRARRPARNPGPGDRDLLVPEIRLRARRSHHGGQAGPAPAGGGDGQPGRAAAARHLRAIGGRRGWGGTRRETTP